MSLFTAVGWMLLLVLWETTAIAAALALFRTVNSDRNASRDYAWALVGLTLSAAAMPVTLLWQIRGGPQLGAVASPASIAAATTAKLLPFETFLQSPAIDTAVAGAAMLWAAGALVLLLRLAGGRLVIGSVVARAQPVADETLLRMVAAFADRADLRTPIALALSDAIDAPAVVGWRRPTILMPSAARHQLSEDDLSGAIAHEIAHIRRQDYGVNLLQSIAETLLFFSPAALWMSRRVREAREFCCDEEAVAAIGSAPQYVHALTTLAAFQPALRPKSALGISGPRLVTRIHRLLEEDSMPRHTRVRIAALAGALVLAVLAGTQTSAAAAFRTLQQAHSSVHKTSEPGLTLPTIIHEVKAQYTDDAKKRKVHGEVELIEIVQTDGTVRDVKVVKSLDPDLDAQAVAAAEQWRFNPGTKDGKPVDVQVNIEMTFTLK
jgi:TonB family protein